MILLCSCKRYNISLISLFNLYDLFSAFICANIIGGLVDNLFGVKTFNPFPSSDDISDKSSSYAFCLLKFTFSGIAFCDGNCIDANPGLSSLYLKKRKI